MQIKARNPISRSLITQSSFLNDAPAALIALAGETCAAFTFGIVARIVRNILHQMKHIKLYTPNLYDSNSLLYVTRRALYDFL